MDFTGTHKELYSQTKIWFNWDKIILDWASEGTKKGNYGVEKFLEKLFKKNPFLYLAVQRKVGVQGCPK